MDKLKIEISEDGTIKTSSDAVSMPNHQSAEAFLREMARLAGGTTTRRHKHGHSHTHTHEHGHDHNHIDQ